MHNVIRNSLLVKECQMKIWEKRDKGKNGSKWN